MSKSKLVQFLNFPYPFYENSFQAVKISLSIGIFIGFFCYYFAPFGMIHIDPYSRMGYGVVSFLICSFFMIVLPMFFPRSLSTSKWKIYKELIWILAINLTLAFGNYYYSAVIFVENYKLEFNLRVFIWVFLVTITIAIIPAITIILYKQIFVYKNIVKEVKKIDAKLVMKNNPLHKVKEEIEINSEVLKENLKLNINNLVFISSSGNYVEVYFLEDSELRKKVIRSSISRIENQFKEFNNILRCHRSYLINLNKIDRVTGNLQGYQLHFEGIEDAVPVSRSYTKRIKEYYFA